MALVSLPCKVRISPSTGVWKESLSPGYVDVQIELKGVTKILRVERWLRESWASLVGMAEKAVHSLKPHFWSQL